MSGSFSDNTASSRFEYVVNGETAFAKYRITGDTLFIDYVEAPPALRGTGAAGKLMEQVMAEARKRKFSVVPICGYAAAWLTKHPEYKDMLGR